MSHPRGPLASSISVLSIALSGILALLSACRGEPEGHALQVYAAASLTDVMEAFADTFRSMSGGMPVTVNVAGSSLLAKQIEHGANADLFVSAHPDWTTYLYEEDHVRTLVELPISNRLVEIRRRGDSGKSLWGGSSRSSQGGSRESQRIALADPAHVPAGMYARKALECEGRWEALEGVVVFTLDVRAAVAAVQTGAATSAIVYASDAWMMRALEVTEVGSEGCRPRIRYTAAIVRGSEREEEALRFVAWLRAPEARVWWRRFGFGIHGDG